MEYGLFRSDKIAIALIIAAGVQVAVDTGKITAGYSQCDSMPRLKFVAREP
jgi:hypothetical protein